MSSLADPKLAAGLAKPERFDAVPPIILRELAVAMGEGADKYGRFNWRVTEVVASTYYAAAMRHLTAWYAGEDDDPYSPHKQSHLIKAMSSLTVLFDAMMCEQMVDDRPTNEHRKAS